MSAITLDNIRHQSAILIYTVPSPPVASWIVMEKAAPQGFTLIEVLIAIVLFSMLAFLFASMMSQMSRTKAKLEQDLDLMQVREMLMGALDCDAIFASHSPAIDPAAPGANCNSTSAANGQLGPFLRLYRKTRNGASRQVGTWDAATSTQTVGKWAIRVSCSAADQSLIIRAARPKTGGGFFEDPLYAIALDWSNAKGLLYGETSPACFQSTSGPLLSTTVGQTWTAFPCNGGTSAGPVNCPGGYVVSGCSAWTGQAWYGTAAWRQGNGCGGTCGGGATTDFRIETTCLKRNP